MFPYAKQVWVIFLLIVATQLGAEIGSIADERWKKELEKWQENGTTPEFELLREKMDALAGSSQIEPARETYLRILRELQGGIPWLDVPYTRSLFISWLEGARLIATKDEDLSWIHYYLARLLEENSAYEFDPDRWISLYQSSVFLDGLYPEQALLAKLRQADLLARYGHQQLDNLGEIIRRPDFAAAVEIYQELLESDENLKPDTKDKISLRLEEILESRLEWLSHRSFFPDTEVQLSLRSHNLETVEVEIFRLVDHTGIELGEQGGLDAKQAIIAIEPIQRFVYNPKPDFPFYPTEDHWDLGVQSEGIYFVRARSGDIIDQSFYLVTDLALFAHYSNSGLYLQGLNVDTGEPVETLKWRILARNPDGDVIDLKGEQSTDYLSKIEHDLSGSAEVWIIAESVGMPGLLRAKPVDFAEPAMSWEVETNRPTARIGDVVLWKAMPDRSRCLSYENLDWSQPVYSRWLAPDGTTLSRQKHEPGRYRKITGQFIPEASHGTGFYSVRFEGISLSGTPLISTKQPVIYIGPGEDGTIRAQYHWDAPQIDLLPVWILERPGINGFLTLQTAAGNPVSGAVVTISIYPSDNAGAVLIEENLRSDSQGRVALNWDSIPDNLLPGYYRLQTKVQLGETTTVCEDHWVEVRSRSIRPEIKIAQQIYRPGEIVSLTLELNHIEALETAVSGVLIVHRDQWQRTYVHRKRGSEISEEAWMTLPERSLLGRSQSDYRIGTEGYYTEEIFRIETKVDSGLFHFDIPAVEEGFYRVSWVGNTPSGQLGKTEAEFRVYRAGSLHRGSRFPELNIIVNETPLSSQSTNHILLTAPHVNATFLFTAGINGPDVRRIASSASGDAMVSFELPQTRHDWMWMELNTFHQGEWLSRNLLAPISQPDYYLVVDADIPDRNFHPGEHLSVDLKITDLNGDKVEADIHVAVLPLAAMNVGNAFAYFRQKELFSKPMPWITWSSLSAFPFKDNSTKSDLSVLLPNANESDYDIRLYAQWQNYRNLISAPSLWLNHFQADENGFADLEFALPDYSSDWIVQIHVTDENGRKGRFEQTISTYSPIELDWLAPNILYLGDEINQPAKLSNQSGHYVDGRIYLKILQNGSAVEKSQWQISLSPGESVEIPIQFQPAVNGILEVQLSFDSDQVQQQVHRKMIIADADAIGPFWLLQDPDNLAGDSDITKTIYGLKDLLIFSINLPLRHDTLQMEAFAGAIFRNGIFATTLLREDNTVDKNFDWMFLVDHQNEDGGWGRTVGLNSDPWFTALILWMVSESVDEAVHPIKEMASKAHAYLIDNLMVNHGDNLLNTWILHANSYYQNNFGEGRLERLEARAYLNLMRSLDKLGVEAKALLLSVSLLQQFEEEAVLLLSNLQDSFVRNNYEWTTKEHRFGRLFPLLTLRVLLWAHADWDGINRLAQILPEALISHQQDVLSTFLAQVITAEYLLSRPLSSQATDTVFYLTLQKISLAQSEFDGSVRMTFVRKVLTPTLLKGLVEREEEWDLGSPLTTGDSLEMQVQIAFNKEPGQKIIRLRTPSGLSSANGMNSIRWLSDSVNHQIITGSDYTDILFLSDEPCIFEFHYSLRAEVAGKFTIPAILVFSQKALTPEIISEPVFIEVMPTQ